MIVTDHHQLGERLPGGRGDRPSGAARRQRIRSTACAGPGVAFKLAWALCQRASQAKRVSPAMRDFLLSAVGLAALGTVADVVPLVDENRILVRHGLVSLRERPVPGVAALMHVTGLDQKSHLSSEDIAFTLGPRLNAAGRLGQAQLARRTAHHAGRPSGPPPWPPTSTNSTATRDKLERSVYLAAHKQAKEQFDPDRDPAIVLAGMGWHAGVIGIVAGRLAEKYHRPTVIISWDQVGAKPGVGSARSAGGLDLHAALAACGHHLLSHGGHAQAAGLEDRGTQAGRLPQRVLRIRGDANLAETDRVPEICIDAEAPLSQLTLQTVRADRAVGAVWAGQSAARFCVPAACGCASLRGGSARASGICR